MTGTVILTIISFAIAGIIAIIVTIVLIHKKRNKTNRETINRLERNKNLIISVSILSELNKVESLINNDELRNMYEEWKNRFKEIKDEDVPKITDQIIELEDNVSSLKEKELIYNIAKIELNIYYVKMKAKYLLNEIKEITLSEQKNREIVTSLKTEYREVINKYKNNYNDYEEMNSPIELQFENIDKLFSAFEMAMDNNSYTEVGKIVKALTDTIGNLKIIVEEAPIIISLGKSIIPKKIKDIEFLYNKLTKEGYILDYLNLEYNVTEANKKISDIFSRLNVLNVEDSIFELKTIVDYFDSLYNDFDKEKISKKLFEEHSRILTIKISRLTHIAHNLAVKFEDIKFSYDLTDEDKNVIDDIIIKLDEIKKDFDDLVNVHRSKVVAFSRLVKEVEQINLKVANIEDKLESALRNLGSLKEDELRAREQLDEIRDILKKSKAKMRSYKLPIIPENYFIELSEASEAVGEIIRELDKKPIAIKVLNIRVDTARDLVLKLYNTTKETIKTAQMAEMAIVYGNRYRPINHDIMLGLTKAENLFFKGKFKNSLENAIDAINIIEPGIYQRLLESYQK